jgi:ribosome-associated heat shock protein Hsp15
VPADPPDLVRVRLDVWLDVACLFKTRSAAQKACTRGKVEVNGVAAKPHRQIQPGDEIVLARPFGRKQRITVRWLADRHLPKADARALFEDHTPPPSADEIEMRRLVRMSAPTRVGGAPDKRQRRMLRKLKGL